MKKQWDDPAKREPKAETMNTPGSFEAFTDLMKRFVQVKPEEIASRVPDDEKTA